jgi:hypothetical protein
MAFPTVFAEPALFPEAIQSFKVITLFLYILFKVIALYLHQIIKVIAL